MWRTTTLQSNWRITKSLRMIFSLFIHWSTVRRMKIILQETITAGLRYIWFRIKTLTNLRKTSSMFYMTINVIQNRLIKIIFNFLNEFLMKKEIQCSDWISMQLKALINLIEGMLILAKRRRKFKRWISVK